MTDLIDCIAYIRDGLAKLPPPSDAYPDTERHKALDELVAAIVRDLPKAKIDTRSDGARVSIAGIRTTCTAGVQGGLTNWIVAARRRLDNTGWVQTTGEKENLR